MGLEPSMGLEFHGDSASGFRFSSQGFGMGLPGLEICGTIDFWETSLTRRLAVHRSYARFCLSSKLCVCLFLRRARRTFLEDSSVRIGWCSVVSFSGKDCMQSPIEDNELENQNLNNAPFRLPWSHAKQES